MSVFDRITGKSGAKVVVRADLKQLENHLAEFSAEIKAYKEELESKSDAKQIELPTAEAIAEQFGEVMLEKTDGDLPENAAEIVMALAEKAIEIFEALLLVEEEPEEIEEAVDDEEMSEAETEVDATDEAEAKAIKADAKLKQRLMTALVTTNKEIDDLMAVVVDDLGNATKAVSGVAKRVDGVAETVDANTVLLTTLVAEVKALKAEQTKTARDAKFVRGRIASTANGRNRASESKETEVEEADVDLPEEIKNAGMLEGTRLTGPLKPLLKR